MAKAEQVIEEFIRRGRWPSPGTLPVCIRLPQIGHVPPKKKSKLLDTPTDID